MTTTITIGGASFTLVPLPCDSIPGVLQPSSIEWDAQEAVAVSTSPFTGQSQIYDWMASWWEGTLSLPKMDRASADAWSAFVLACRGGANVFQLGDPKAREPKGTALGAGEVIGNGQTGYVLNTTGWKANQPALFLAGDFIQIGYRLYKLTGNASSDASGNATLYIWPNLRDTVSSLTPIASRNCKGLFRLKQTANKWSTNPGAYGVSGLPIREAF